MNDTPARLLRSHPPTVARALDRSVTGRPRRFWPHPAAALAGPLVSLCLLALGLSPTVFAADAGSYYEDALRRYERKDMAGAVIQLKNALQRDGALLAAQLLLGRVLLDQGDAIGAEQALAKAVKLGANRAEVLPHLARALAAQTKYRDILERVPADDLPPEPHLTVLLLRIEAHTELGQYAQATADLASARALKPGSSAVTLAEAHLAFRQRDLARASALAEQAARQAPGEVAAWFSWGSYLHARGDLDSALAKYDKALALVPTHIEALIARAGIYVDRRRDADALADIQAIRRLEASEPRMNYLRAVLLARQGQTTEATQALREVVAIVDAIPPDIARRRGQLLLMGGLAHYGLGQYEKTVPYLDNYLQINPGHAGARKLLATLRMAFSRPQDAIALLEPVVRAEPRDGDAASLLASAYTATGQFQKAAPLLERALRSAADPTPVKAELGFARIGAGQLAEGLKLLEESFRANPRNARVGMALAALKLRNGEPKAAVDIAQKLLQADDRNAAAWNLLGAASVAANDRAGARRAYQRALELAPRERAARLNLARLDTAEGKLDAARAQLLALHKTYPKAPEVPLELARVERAAQRKEDTYRWLEKSLALAPDNLAATQLLVDMLLADRQAERALTVVRTTETRQPENLDVLLLLARVQIAAGKAQDARTALARASKLAGFDPDWQLKIARMQMAAGHRDGAVFALEKALTDGARHAEAEAYLGEIEAMSGQIERANARLAKLRAQFGETAAALRLKADIDFSRKAYREAAEGYRAALAKAPGTDTVLRAYRATVLSAGHAKGAELLAAWSARHPHDLGARRALAEAELAAGRLPQARAAYEQLLTRSGDNDAETLNNLAIILQRMNDAGALAMAERAQRAAPNDAAINDTLGWLLVQAGKLEPGLRFLREARLRDPSSPDIRYHLAYALRRAGRHAEARSELDEALRSPAFESRALAQALRNELGP